MSPRNPWRLLLIATAGLALPAPAQRLDWDALWQQGLDEVDRQLSGYGYEVDRDALRNLPRYDDLMAYGTLLKKALEEGSVEDLAWLRPGVEASLKYLDQFPAAAPYADWLRQQADYFIVASEAVAEVPEVPAKPPPPAREAPPLVLAPRPPEAPRTPPQVKKKVAQQARKPEAWKKRVGSRPKPARADALVPVLKKEFRAVGVPEELVWLAEVESSMDPRARNPVGAAGLFQFMPPTAQRFGLRTASPDERLEPERSANAAARYLKFLHGRFGSWPLALAAYNAGEGRVGRLLRQHGASDFEGIADALPAETQMYVPKVAAVIELREGVALSSLPGPRA